MAASVQFRPQNRDLGVLMRDVDEDLAIYLGLPNEITDDDSFLLSSQTSQYEVVMEMATADSEWLIAEPDLSVLPKVQNKELQVTKSEPASNTSEDSAPSPSKPKSPPSSPSTDNAASIKRPSSSRSQKPNSRPSTSGVRRQIVTSKSKPSCPSISSSRPTIPSDQTTISKTASSSRSSTPTRKSSIHSDKSALSSSARSSGQKVASSTKCKNPVSSLSSSSGVGSSETVKSKPLKPRNVMPLSQYNAVQNPEVSMPNKWPASASRGRPSSANSCSNNNGKLLRRKSCSPAKTRAPNIALGGNKSGSRTQGHGNDDDDVNPVLIGTKMVERVVNMRKLAPPKQDHHERRAVSHHQDKPKRSAKDSSSGFGRSLSSKSLDMAIRHMDIRRSIPDNFGPAVATSGVKPRTATAKICDVTNVTETSSSSSSSGNDSSRTVWIVAESSLRPS